MPAARCPQHTSLPPPAPHCDQNPIQLFNSIWLGAVVTVVEAHHAEGDGECEYVREM